MRNRFPVLCPVLLRVLGPGMVQTAAGKDDSGQLVYSVISDRHSAQTRFTMDTTVPRLDSWQLAYLHLTSWTWRESNFQFTFHSLSLANGVGLG